MPRQSSLDGSRDASRCEPKQGDAGGGTARDGHAPPVPRPFWLTKTLDTLTPGEWESLCDGCGRCCLVKLEDEDTGAILKTDIACKLLDAGSCRCRSYERRQEKVHDCIKLTPDTVREIPWLPSTCAYRLVREGKPLRPWHPLVSGSPDTVHEAGISVRGRTGGSERTVKLRDYVDHIVGDDD